MILLVVTLADLPPHALGWLLLICGLGLFLWVGHDIAMGETGVECPTETRWEMVSQDEDPARFRRLIIANLACGAVLVGIGMYLLIFKS